MDVTPLVKAGQQIIQSYSGGQFKISGKTYQGAVIVTPEQTVSWDAPDFAQLTAAHFPDLKKSEVILLGTGAKMHFLPPALKKALKEKGMNVESMDTAAACRTYNVLMAEGRLVAAALLPFT